MNVPTARGELLGGFEDAGFVEGQYPAVPHDPAPIDHHGFDVAGLP